MSGGSNKYKSDSLLLGIGAPLCCGLRRDVALPRDMWPLPAAGYTNESKSPSGLEEPRVQDFWLGGIGRSWPRTVLGRLDIAMRWSTCGWSGEALEDHRHALAATDAHGLQAELLVVPLQ